MRKLQLDAVIFGGGIAGLWLLAELRRRGYAALLLEANALGAGQTIAAQGIIHGGAKYALMRRLTAASDAMAEMPARWQRHLSGASEPDLQAVHIAAEQHMMWMPPQAVGGLLSFMTSKIMQSRTKVLAAAERPDALQGGHVLALDETVLNSASLLRILAEQQAAWIRRIAWPDGLTMSHQDGAVDEIRVDVGSEEIALLPGCVLLAAGAGNETLLAALGRDAMPLAQRRPLRMILLRNAPAPLWAHCVVGGPNPLFTVTSHSAADGSLIWYVGGELAERGATFSDDAAIEMAQELFSEMMPGCDFAAAAWATFIVDRAEGRAGGKRPDDVVVSEIAPRTLALWPTKLALAPRLADLVVARMPAPAVGGIDADLLAGWPQPEVAAPPWDEVATWK